jgi:hypothetical protein
MYICPICPASYLLFHLIPPCLFVLQSPPHSVIMSSICYIVVVVFSFILVCVLSISGFASFVDGVSFVLGMIELLLNRLMEDTCECLLEGR